MDEREEGELSGSEQHVTYNPIIRPDASQYRNVSPTVISSEEEYSSDSDSDTPCLPKKKKKPCKRMDTDISQNQCSNFPPNEFLMNGAEKMEELPVKRTKRNNIWANVLGEQTLSQSIGSVGLKKLDGDRNVENYDYHGAAAHYKSDSENEDGEIDEDENNETKEIKEKRLSRKRPIKDRLGGRSPTCITELKDIEVDSTWTDEELGNAIASALFEQKPELIVRVVEVMGRDKALELYTNTQEVENNGGMMTMDNYRRRTAGGVYIQLLKKIPELEAAQLQKIFPVEKNASQWGRRKRVPRRRIRHDSKPQAQASTTGEVEEDNSANLEGQLSDNPGGAKCPGSTPVTTPQPSDNDEPLSPQHKTVEPNTLSESVVASKLLETVVKASEKEDEGSASFSECVFQLNESHDEMELF